ncbi:transglutaminase [Pseudoxanthomonas kalamensis DSM 18571]|uniref:transglutaminase family protein n=1 Tax=Pseudoxanthomonas kalamensis TaxID=289483 RepID=UPI0013918553|nr:transglutaminase family protein [Pseudoxanthomonas kalamensis]KAF1712154.1 transglutaminase [Pseudoxanthomonas kalamensis DSM 18571]
MQYDVRLQLNYEYQHPVADARHLLRVMPRALPGIQQVQEAKLKIEPWPEERSGFDDFFGNGVTEIVLRAPHRTLALEMRARVQVERQPPELDLSPDLQGLRAEVAETGLLAADAPCHFLPPSPHVPLFERITAYAARSVRPGSSALDIVQDLGRRLRGDFAYDPEATDVDTPLGQAFDMRAGVCQDFSQIMIAGLRGLGIPAGYVSGFLRTIPPAGAKRLEGADATHAWVRAWCGRQMGWREFDPTNAMPAGDDHITLGHGRDYGDISPIAGVLRTTGEHEACQAVDVVPLG